MITATGPRVPGIGPIPCDVMIVGEGPGEQEAEGFWRGSQFVREPFVGASGAEQDRFLMMNGLHRHRCYITNLIKNWIPGNGNPTTDDVSAAESELRDEIATCRPRFILAVGAFSTRWFLGSVDMESVHGHAYQSERAPGSTVIPCFHPAFGLRDPDAKTLVWWDYSQAARYVRGELDAVPIRDEYPDPDYFEPTLEEFYTYLSHEPAAPLAVDVEGSIEYRDQWWGFSISKFPGTGLVVRRANPDFDAYVATLNWHLEAAAPIVVYHNFLGIDADILRRMGVSHHCVRGRVFDTMLAAFFLRVKPQGLKALARRHCGMEMRTYEEVIGDAATEKEISYLVRVAEGAWEKPEPRLVYENDGTVRVYKPQPLATRAEKILADWGQDQAGVDLTARWRQIDSVLRRSATDTLGPWPWATLDDVSLDSAVRYSGRDPDATIRVFYQLAPETQRRGLTERLLLDQRLLPVFDEMQSTGFIASRAHFEKLSADMWDDMMRIGAQISHRFNDDKPFNPGSADQVARLADSRGLKGAKRSKKTHKISTSKKSMEHLRGVDEAMNLIFSWRERQKIKTSFADPILERLPTDLPYGRVTCNIRITRTNSDRISATDPNLTAIPVDKGQEDDPYARIRAGFGAPEGMKLGGADLSQIEMRVIADESRDPFMCALFHEERDIHAETAVKIFHLDPTRTWDNNKGEFVYPSVHKSRPRNPTKRAGFGVGTGIQGPGLLDQLRQMGCEGWTVAKFPDKTTDCVSDWCPGGIIHEWFKVFPGVKGFFERCKARTFRDGFIAEKGGFPRYLPGIWSRDEYTAAEAGRQSHSHVIQGTAQWMLRVAMDYIAPQIEKLRDDSGLFVRWVLQIHDEIIFCFHPDLEEEVQRIALDGLVNHTPQLSVPIKASWSTGLTWDKLK